MKWIAYKLFSLLAFLLALAGFTIAAIGVILVLPYIWLWQHESEQPRGFQPKIDFDPEDGADNVMNIKDWNNLK